MVATNKKIIVDTQKIKRKESKHNSKENHKTVREDTKRRRSEWRKTTEAIRKQRTKWQ